MEFDLIVLGGGNAYSLASDAARAGWKVALVERDRLGGTCPNRGCIPSKRLIAHAEVALAIRDAARFHMDATLRSVDADAILREVNEEAGRVDEKIGAATPESLSIFRAHGVFAGPREVRAGDALLRAPRIVIATGTRPRPHGLPGLEGAPVWTSDEVFALDRAPASLVIVGGGYIGCELAHFFEGVGVQTTLIHRGAELLEREDGELRALFMRAFTARVETRLSTEISAASHDGGRFHLELAAEGRGRSTHESEALLFAIGRIPNTDSIELGRAGLSTDSRGYLEVNDRLETATEGIFALGDVAGRHAFTHSASFEAKYLGRRFLEGLDAPIEYGAMPHAVFTRPEIAGVGATEEELRAKGIAYVKGAASYKSAAKGRSVREEHGLCKFLLSPEGEILGCHIVGHEAATLLHEVIPVMRWRNHISSLTEIIHIHPSLSEVVRNAARLAESSYRAR